MEQQLMFEKILVANRGEIAVRIMRSAQELDIKTVAIYEETDKDAFHISCCSMSPPHPNGAHVDFPL